MTQGFGPKLRVALFPASAYSHSFDTIMLDHSLKINLEVKIRGGHLPQKQARFS